MDIQKEQLPAHAILSYSKNSIQIQALQYRSLTMVSDKAITVFDDKISIQNLNQDYFKGLDLNGIEVIIVGHQDTYADVAFELRQQFAKQQIGIEVMVLGAACRTFNILLSEGRGILGVFLLG